MKTETFGRHFELAKPKLNLSSHDPRAITRAILAHFSFSMATTPLLKIILSQSSIVAPGITERKNGN